MAITTRLTTLVGAAGTEHALIEAVRGGLPFETFAAVRDALGLSGKELAQLIGIAERTLQTRKHTGRFTPAESDRLLRVARAYARTVEFFGSPEAASAWLKKPAPALHEQTPLSLLDTEVGAQQVITLLNQLEYGVLP